MGMPLPRTGWTVEMVQALPDDGNRYEVIDGELFVTPAPAWPHQSAVGELHARLWSYLREHRAAHVLIAPADVKYGPRELVQPDLFVVPLVAGRKPASFSEAGRLLLAVEVVSPSSARADRLVKRRLYRRHGVAEYWVVDLDARVVERSRPDEDHVELVAETLEWRPAPGLEPLVIDLAEYFAEVLGE